MGTPNFARPNNASKYFAVLCDVEEKSVECNECGDTYWEWESEYEEIETTKKCSCGSEDFSFETKQRSPETWECEDFINNIGDFIEEKGGTAENESIGNDRNYPVQSLGYFQESKWYGDIEVEVRVVATLTSAYYEGATLDFTIEIFNGSEFVNIEEGFYTVTERDILEDLFEIGYEHYYSDMNKGMRKLQVKNAEKWVEKIISELSEQMEQIFENYTQHKLERTALFSNGEAIYETAK